MVKIMRVNEVKEVREVLVKREYIADDGRIFLCDTECKQYEKSELCAISKQLKRLTDINKFVSQNDIWDDCSDDYRIEIFNVENEKDLENVRRYIHLMTSENISLPGLTVGHEVIIFWNYDEDYCWAFGDGSIDAFCDYIRGNLTKLITPKEEKTEE